jgi:hypothetical protein
VVSSSWIFSSSQWWTVSASNLFYKEEKEKVLICGTCQFSWYKYSRMINFKNGWCCGLDKCPPKVHVLKPWLPCWHYWEVGKL